MSSHSAKVKHARIGSGTFFFAPGMKAEVGKLHQPSSLTLMTTRVGADAGRLEPQPILKIGPRKNLQV